MEAEAEILARPIVKWAGGKRELLPELLRRAPKAIDHYVEPFAGGAALFFALAEQGRFARASLFDQNRELVACYRAVRDDVEALIKKLDTAAFKHDKTVFYAIRSQRTDGMTDVERGARLLYLNKTCFNGLWRVNSRGEFNVPFGSYRSPKILDPVRLRAAARALRGVAIEEGDFETALDGLGKKDFVYFDPPYVPVSKTANFTSYGEGGFGAADQRRLRDRLKELGRRGVPALLSNADTDDARELYAEFVVESVQVRRSINANTTRRGPVGEVLVAWKPKKKR